LLVLFAGLGMAADKYFALIEEEGQLAMDLGDAETEVGRLDDLKNQRVEINQRLTQLKNRAVTESDIKVIPDELTELVRKTGCQFRRIEVSTPRTRSWKTDDHPLLDNSGEQETQSGGTGYDLLTYEVSLNATGNLDNLKRLFAGIHGMDRMLHVKTLQVQPDAQTKSIQMRTDLLLFGLEKAKQSESSGPALEGAPEPPGGSE
jgi:hypothetical protein